MSRFVFALALGAIVGGAAGAGAVSWKHRHDAAPKQEPPPEESEQATLWKGRTELFVEHPPLAPAVPAEFVVHVTDVTTGEARATGPVAFTLELTGEPAIEHVEEVPRRPGIYIPTLAFPKPGHWRVTIRVDDDALVLTAHVHAPGERKHEHEAEAAEGIRFLKEQQWLLRLRAEPVGRRKLVERMRVTGVVAVRPGGRAMVTPPVDGRLASPPDRTLPFPGERVKADQVLATVHPPFPDLAAKLVEAEADVVRTRLASEQSEAALARTRRLVAEKARSERELEEADFAARTAKAAHDGAVRLADAYRKVGTGFELRAPIDGVVVDVAAVAGETVHSERPVFTIVDTSSVRLEARVPETDVPRAAGRGTLVERADARGRFVEVAGPPAYVSPQVDAASRTVTVAYDLPNADGTWRAGLEISLLIETARSEDAIAVPESAIVEEDGRPVAFVHESGESFAKRELEIGLRDGGWVEVRRGLEEGDRVVTHGAYAVRLASVSGAIPAHSHSH